MTSEDRDAAIDRYDGRLDDREKDVARFIEGALVGTLLIFPKIVLTTRAILFQPIIFIRSFVRSNDAHPAFNDRYSRALTYLALSLLLFVLYGSVIEYVRQVSAGVGLPRAAAARPEEGAADVLQSIGNIYASITGAVTSGEITRLFLFIVPVLVALSIHGWAVTRVTRKCKRPIDFLTATQIAAYFLGALYLGFTLFVAIFLPVMLTGIAPTVLPFVTFGLTAGLIVLLIGNYVRVTAFLLGESIKHAVGVCLKSFLLFYVGNLVVFLIALPLALPAFDFEKGRDLITRLENLTGGARKAPVAPPNQIEPTLGGALLGGATGAMLRAPSTGQPLTPEITPSAEAESPR